MSDQHSDAAIQILEQRRDQLLAEARAQAEELNRAIQRLKGAKGNPSPLLEFPEVRPGQWRGMDIKSALVAYLNERPGGVLTTRVAADLVRGGVEFGKKRSDPRRYVRITIGNNRKVFAYDETTDTVRLLAEQKPEGKRAAG